MDLMSNKIHREQLNTGDHIYTWRRGYSYSHHGIFVGDGKVIHLIRAPGPLILSSSDHEVSPSHPLGSDRVVCCSIEEFLSGGDLYLYEYGVKRASFLIKRGGTCTRTLSDPPTDVLHRASILLEKGFGDYHLFKNNCEDFALYCKTGLLNVDRSGLSMSGQIQILLDMFAAVYITPSHFLPSCFSSVELLVVYGFAYCLCRLANVRGTVKVAVDQWDLRMEYGSRRRRSFVCYLRSIISVFIYWSWTPVSGILLWIRFLFLYIVLNCTVSALLEDHRMDLELGEYEAYSIWLLGCWYWSSESSGIYFWTKLAFLYHSLLFFVSDHQKRMKLQKYCGTTELLLLVWYWTPESTILVWIRSLLFNILLRNFVPDHLRNPHSKVLKFFCACLVIQSASIFLGLDYGDYLFRITKNIFYL